MRSWSSFIFSFLAVAVVPDIAQTNTAELAESIIDASGGAITNTKVVAANTGTGKLREDGRLW